MPIPTYRGYVFTTPEADGSQTVSIATGLDGAQPRGIFAQHVRSTSVVIDGDVAFRKRGDGRYTPEVVQVFADMTGGAVHVAPLNLP